MSALISDTVVQVIVPGGILLASLLGSPHCVAMCGGLVVNFAKGGKALVLYHLGRLISYAALGALAGAFGRLAFESSVAPKLSLLTTLLFTAVLIAVGIRRFQGRSLHVKLPRILSKVISSGMARALEHPKNLMAPLLLGFLSALLPCGWLYTFVLAAGVTKSAALGALSLASFWLGTVPALSAIPTLINQASSKLRVSAPAISGVLMITLGLFSLSLHAAYFFSKPLLSTQSCPLHHQ